MKGKLRQCISPEDLRVPDDILQLNGRDIPFVNNVGYLDVAFDRRMAWGHHIERTVAKVLRTYVRTCSLLKSGRLSTSTIHTLYKVLIRSAMTYARPTCEHVADAHRLKLQRLQNTVLRDTGNTDRSISSSQIPCGFQNFYSR